MHADSLVLFSTLTDEACPSVPPAGTSITTWKWLRAKIEHEGHHRGHQLLGRLGIVPPLFGLTSEEVQGRSVSS